MAAAPRCCLVRAVLLRAVVWSLAAQPAVLASALYTEQDPLVLLDSANIKSRTQNSSAAWLVQFYSSWCGHCIQYSQTWTQLARDVTGWQQVIHVAVLDCAQELNYDICKEYGIHYYPTFRYFRAHRQPGDFGETYRSADRQVQTVRQFMINFLQNHTRQDRPDYCPPMEPSSAVDVLSLLGQRSDHYTAFVIEEPQSYVGREVMLDVSRVSGLVVRRVLSSELPLLDTLGITQLPSVYLLFPNGTHTHLSVHKRLRYFFSSSLRALAGVYVRQKDTSQPSHRVAVQDTQPVQPWMDFDSSRVYQADLESALHYLLRVEMASHNTLQGEELLIFKDFVTMLAKLYPGRQSVVKVLASLLDWLVRLPINQLPYQAVLDLVDNKMMMPGHFLGAELQWVGCQGTRPGLRGYPCSVWMLFHVLSVQSHARPHALDHTGQPVAVLQVMRRYIKTFFGCRDCGRHFDQQAAATLQKVQTSSQAVLWLWSTHNLVNARLAGALSEDPQFPKVPWPGAALCPSCHEEREGIHMWNEEQVLQFLLGHYGADSLSPQHLLPPPGPILARQQQEKQEEAAQKPRQEEKVEDARPGSGVWIQGFTSLDMSLCLLLYVTSSLLLLLLFFFFRIRSWRSRARLQRLHV